MKRGQFECMVNIVARARKDDDIWWAGYLWTGLTKAQWVKMSAALASNGVVDMVIRGDAKYFRFPSGIEAKDCRK